jgi:hypothetical protein
LLGLGCARIVDGGRGEEDGIEITSDEIFVRATCCEYTRKAGWQLDISSALDEPVHEDI